MENSTIAQTETHFLESLDVEPGHYIIGGGISGLIFQYYHPEFTIITPEVGGMFNKTHMVWLHDTAETRKFCTDLGIQNIDKLSRRSYIGYYWKGWIQETLYPGMNLEMIQKKMSDWNEPIDKSFIPKTFDMSTTKRNQVNYLNSLNVNLSEIIEKLNSNSKVITGFVKKIDSTRVTYENPVGELNTVKYIGLVSTIPAPFFWKGYGVDRDFKSKLITNIITDKKPDFFDDKFEMLYYDDSYPFSRVSHLSGKYAIEFTGLITKDEFIKLYPDINVVDYVPVKHGRIFENEENISPQVNITFLGRFAQWKYGITTEWVIRDTLNYVGK